MHRPNLEVLEDRSVPAFLAPVDYAVGSYPYDVKAGDFNGDSILDLVTANIGDNTVSVLLGNPDGTFQPAHTSATGPNAQSVAVGDFNEDGKLDLATANYDYYGNNDVGILLGHGDGTFAPAVHSSNGSTQASQGVATDDLNSDGHEDLVVTSDSVGDETQPYVSVLLGNGDGTFAPAVAYDAIGGGVPSAPVLADFDSDGNPDVAWANEGGSVKILLGNGDGTLQAPRDFATDRGADSVAVGDFNADGNLDLATASYFGKLSVLLGNGDGTFQAAQSLNAWWAYSVTAGDVNGDGVLDLVVSGGVLLGIGDGSFGSLIATDSGGSVLADFNADGRLDAAGANPSFDTVSVFINDGNWPALDTPAISIHGVNVTEGNTGAVTAAFTVTLSRPAAVDVTVHYATADGTAAAGSDYQAASGTLIIPAGQTTGTVTVMVNGDRLAEPNETFFLNLTGATNATIVDGQGMVTIVGDEPRISITDVTKYEGRTHKTTLFTFTVTLSAAYDQPVTVSFQTVNGTGTSNNDYVAKTGTLTFAPGGTTKTITIEVKGDSKKEASETFYLDLFALSINALFTKSRGIGTILNDD